MIMKLLFQELNPIGTTSWKERQDGLRLSLSPKSHNIMWTCNLPHHSFHSALSQGHSTYGVLHSQGINRCTTQPCFLQHQPAFMNIKTTELSNNFHGVLHTLWTIYHFWVAMISLRIGDMVMLS